MAINYTWDVSKVDTYPTKSSQSDVVYRVHWRLKGTDDSNNDSDGLAQTNTIYGTQLIDTSDLTSFTAFGKRVFETVGLRPFWRTFSLTSTLSRSGRRP